MKRSIKAKVLKKIIDFDTNHQMHPVSIYISKAKTINNKASIVVSDSGMLSVHVANEQIVPYIPNSQSYATWTEEEYVGTYNFKMSTLVNELQFIQ